MTGFALIGALTLSVVISAGIYWLITNITLRGNKKDDEA